MAAGKAKQDPFAKTREKIPLLQKHASECRNRLNTGTVSEKHAGRKKEYQDWLRLEIRRTEAKISELQLSLPVGK